MDSSANNKHTALFPQQLDAQTQPINQSFVPINAYPSYLINSTQQTGFATGSHDINSNNVTRVSGGQFSNSNNGILQPTPYGDNHSNVSSGQIQGMQYSNHHPPQQQILNHGQYSQQSSNQHIGLMANTSLSSTMSTMNNGNPQLQNMMNIGSSSSYLSHAPVNGVQSAGGSTMAHVNMVGSSSAGPSIGLQSMGMHPMIGLNLNSHQISLPNSSSGLPTSNLNSQQQQQQQQQRTSSGLASKPSTAPKPWQSFPSVSIHREEMTAKIVKLLEEKKPDNPEWVKKLPAMAIKLEENLYHSANSLEEYSESLTLKERLKQLALQTGGNKQVLNRPMQQLNGQQPISYPNSNQQSRPFASSTTQNMSHFPPYQNTSWQSNEPPHQGALASSNIHMPPSGITVNNGFPVSNIILPNTPAIVNNTNQSAVSYFNDNQMQINTTQINAKPSDAQDINGNGIQPHDQSTQLINMSQLNPLLSTNIPNSDNNAGPRHEGGQLPSQGPGPAMPSNSDPGGTDDHRRQVLKQQQQRLLLLRHASKCTIEVNCPTTPHCSSMKVLWKHIMSCKNQECKTAHCVSSRYVLSHYSKCKDSKCPVCAPVREAITQTSKSNSQSDNHVVNRPVAQQDGMPHIYNSNQVLLHGGMSEDNGVTLPPQKKVKYTLKEQQQIPQAPQQLSVPHQLAAIAPTSKPLINLDPVSCGLYCLTNEQITAHINGIHEGMGITATKVKELALPIVEKLLKFPQAYSIFGMPVDPVLLGLPDYFEIIKFPMDLGTVKKKLESLQYRDTTYFVRDVHLALDNAMTYNPKGAPVHNLAKQMKKEFDVEFKNTMTLYQSRLEAARMNEDSCMICGEIKLTFEPPVYYCNGACGGQRIRRNAYYYSAANNTYHWCSVCFNDLKDGVEIPIGDQNTTKVELCQSKKKHIDDAEESWVNCDGCGRWVHTICTLFNTRRNFEDTKYSCPTCLMSRRKIAGESLVSALTSKTKASDLPECNLSQFIEERIVKRLNIAYEADAAIKGVSVSEVEKCPPLVLRQVSSIDKNQPVRDGVRARYKHKGYPVEFPCRTKCLVLFQSIDGQDVILFGMYVYEYGHKCPAPNQRRVYVSYLDSVHYFRPKQYRTVVYHEILIAYLQYVKRRGFHTAHIWSCPPLKGDDYILYCHPNDQKTPKSDKLQKWYADMLDECKLRGIVEEISDLHSEFLVDPTYDATVLPYFEGDYWTTEAEVIIKSLGTGNVDESAIDSSSAVFNSLEPDATKSKRKSKSTTRTGKSIGAVATGVKSDRDPVMAKLASIIEPMKNTFFVARLRSVEYAEQCAKALQTELIAEAEDRAAKESCDSAPASSSSISSSAQQITNESSSKHSNSKPETLESSSTQESNPTESTESAKVVYAVSTGVRGQENEEVAEHKTFETVADSSSIESKQIDVDSSQVETKSDLIKDDTEDVDDIQESDYWDTRQSFLTLCQGNHYQYDQLRRAKHSSLMVLYHMHNPDAPKFLAVCHQCSKEINSGIRRRCESCDWDFCQTCFQTYGQRIHQHTLRAFNVSGQAQVQQLTAQERAERHKALRMHLELLEHASYCKDSTACKESHNCSKMKNFLKHLDSCPNISKGCSYCKKIKIIISVHARQCRREGCQVPKCTEMKENNRQAALRQQAMDDRRRAMCNEMYHNPGGKSTQNQDD